MNEKQIHILGAKVDLLTRQEVFHRLRQWVAGNRPGQHVVTLNPEIALLAEREDGFHKVINRAAITVADGVGLRWAARLFNVDVPDRITGRDVLDCLCRAAVEHRKRAYLVGGKPGVAERAGQKLQSLYPGLIIAGAEEGLSPSEFAVEGAPTIALNERITTARADVLFVAFGAPKQERWIAKNLRRLPTVKVAVGIGGLFDYLAGSVKQPGAFWQKYGLEWLYRLFTQPHRIGRVCNATIVFLTRVIVWRVRMQFVMRKNVVACIVNKARTRVLLVTPWWSNEARWQFPQGGVDKRESPEEAVLREMSEELGTRSFNILRYVPKAHQYDWPRWYRFVKGYKGQDQDLFVLEFTGTDRDLNLQASEELSQWKWVEIDEVLDSLAPRRRDVGEVAMEAMRAVGISTNH